MNPKAIVIILCVIIFGVILAIILKTSKQTTTLNTEELKTLKFVQVIFRHGERTDLNVYPFLNDPYENYTYPPYGVGALTNRGKLQMYNVGEELRERYNEFLGDYYLPNLIKSTTTNTIRTELSLQLVLAGLFPPKNEQIWKSDINWQPIPYKVIPKLQDKIFSSLFCPSYKRAYREFMNTPEIQQNNQNNKEIYDYISLHTGLNLTTPIKLIIIYDRLETRKMLGLQLPKWTEKVYPDELRKWSIKGFQNWCGTDKLKRLFSGYLLKMLINEIYDKINDKINQNLSIYSAHDFNIIAIGLILNLFENHLVPYGGYILIELHQINGIYKLKFYYQDSNQDKPKILKQFNGETSNTIDEVSKYLQKYLPEDHECEEEPDGLELIYDF